MILGIETARSKKGTVICQQKYTLDLLKETQMLRAKPTDTPIEKNPSITTASKESLHDVRS